MIYTIQCNEPVKTLYKAGYKQRGDNRFLFIINDNKRFHAIVKGKIIELHQDKTDIYTNMHKVMDANKKTLRESRRIKEIGKYITGRSEEIKTKLYGDGNRPLSQKMAMLKSRIRFFYLKYVVRRFRKLSAGEKQVILKNNKRIRNATQK